MPLLSCSRNFTRRGIRGVDSNDILLETSDGVAGNSDISVGITEITKDNGATFLRVGA